MSLRLISLQLDNSGAVVGDLESGTPRGRVRVEFRLSRSGELVVASPDPDVFSEFAASVQEIRRITSAVIAFSKASESENVTATPGGRSS